MKTSLQPFVFLTVALAAAGVRAETISPEPDYTLAYNIGVISDYRARGISQSDLRAAAQGGVDFAHKSGFYAGTWASNVNWVKDFNGATKGSVEWDLYGGFKDSIDADWAFDTGFMNYRYPTNNSGESATPGAGLFSNATTVEWYLNLAYKTFNLKYSRSLGDYMGNMDSSGSQYFDLNATFDLGNGFSLTPHIGHQSIPHQGASGHAGDYIDYSLALGKDFGNGLALTATAINTNTHRGAGSFYHDLNGRDLGRGTVNLGVKYTF